MNRPPLPPYSGPNARCPKCQASNGLGSVWHPHRGKPGSPCYFRDRVGEHMCRVCPVCKYGRIEATADTPGPGS